ncbi:ATP-binding protein [Ktedonobacter racemifer]|uniref:sensor histidine kinase n=1 Tax=Ktedonobacter racemifer TaxID=363277 RepID=UPI000948D7A7|nr:ATP-binding protein [Ktedonobacter racemifer]
MGKSSRPVTRRQANRGKRYQRVMPARKRVSHASPLEKAIAHNGTLTLPELNAVLDVLPDSVIVCDREGKILQINAAASQLFELAPDSPYQGTSYRQFLGSYELHDDQQRLSSIEQWPINLALAGKVMSHSPENTLALHLPSGRKIYVYVWRFLLPDTHKHIAKFAYIFRNITFRYQKALHLQRVQQAVLTLTQAIVQVPSDMDFTLPKETPLLSPRLLLVAQQLVDVIHEILDCRRVALWALGSTGYMHYVTGSGFTTEQEHRRRRDSGHLLPTELAGEAVMARLQSNEVIISADHIHFSSEYAREFGSEDRFLIVPLFLEQRLAGALIITKAVLESEYLPEEIELVKAVAAQVVLVVECILCLQEQAETKMKARMLQEMNHITTDFLTLASHELRTPLTGIFGNLQLAQRRLKTLQCQVAEQSEEMETRVEHVQQPLISASQSAELQQRMINNLIDDAHLQSNTLSLCVERCDLLALVKDAVARKQPFLPKRTIILECLPTEHTVPILADVERIRQVLTTYLTNAFRSAPARHPISVQLTVEDTIARVSVHDEGPGISLEEQAHLWDRFYRAKGSAVQHELDLSLGLGLYLCRAFIELHHGNVGVQSTAGQGATFWFTLPIARSTEANMGRSSALVGGS